MKKLLLGTSFALLLSSGGLVAQIPQDRGTDGHYFIAKQVTAAPTVEMVYYTDRREIERAYYARGGRDVEGVVNAFSIESDGHCEIHAMEPTAWYMPEAYGHELMHCVHGKFH